MILGRKLDVSQIFNDAGNVIPVTLIEAGPCFITQVKNEEKDKYSAIQIGFDKIEKKNKIKKTMKGKEYKYLKEQRIESGSQYNVGDKIDVSIFKEGDKVIISGISKGKGFAGAVKRWNFGGKPSTHGAKHEERAMGSVASGIPNRGRITPGKKMPGKLGVERVTVKNLLVVKVNNDKNLLAVKGAVPGRKGALLEIKL